MMFHRISTIVAATAVLAAAFSAQASAEDAWPTRSVTIIVPNDPGTGTDLGARLFAEMWGKEFGQPFVVENVPGAANTIGAAKAAESKADGYTLLHAPLSSIVLAPLTKKDLAYSTDDFVPVGQTGVASNTLVVNPKKLPVDSFAALLEELKKNPGKYNYSSGGAGGLSHLMHELLAKDAGIEITHIPYTSSPEATKALVAGEVDLAIISTTPILPFVETGELKALAVAQAGRIRELPDVPSIHEIVPAYEGVSNWNGIFAPKGTDPAIVEMLSVTLVAYLSSQEGKDAMAKIGVQAAPSSTADFSALVQKDTETWRDVIGGIGLLAN
jgi:tripartite-type tricarboxylate transporter receptor subunit TctC